MTRQDVWAIAAVAVALVVFFSYPKLLFTPFDPEVGGRHRVGTAVTS